MDNPLLKKFPIYDKTTAERRCKHKNEAFVPDWFCPLIKDMCRKDCQCYTPASLHTYVPHRGAVQYSINAPYCDNAMFSGVTYPQAY